MPVRLIDSRQSVTETMDDCLPATFTNNSYTLLRGFLKYIEHLTPTQNKTNRYDLVKQMKNISLPAKQCAELDTLPQLSI
jgi:hypothetical protein